MVCSNCVSVLYSLTNVKHHKRSSVVTPFATTQQLYNCLVVINNLITMVKNKKCCFQVSQHFKMAYPWRWD